MDGAQQTPRLTQALDDKAQAAFVHFFTTLPTDGTVRIFQRTGTRTYYSSHGADVELFSNWYLRFGVEVVPFLCAGPTSPSPCASPAFDRRYTVTVGAIGQSAGGAVERVREAQQHQRKQREGGGQQSAMR